MPAELGISSDKVDYSYTVWARVRSSEVENRGTA